MEPTPVMIHPGNLTTPLKEIMVPKKDTETWDYYEYPENLYTLFNPGSVTADLKYENFNLLPCPLFPYVLV